MMKYLVSNFMQSFSENDLAFFNLECQELASIAETGEAIAPEIWDEFGRTGDKSAWLHYARVGAIAAVFPLLFGIFGYVTRNSAEQLWPTASQQSSGTFSEESDVAVYLVPFEGFPEELANRLAIWLSQDLDLNVKSTPAASVDFAFYDHNRGQHVAESFYTGMVNVAGRLPERARMTAVIFLTEKDIYLQNANARFVFSSHWDQRLSLVATGRIIQGDLHSGGGDRLFNERILKLLKRTIGIQYFEHARSTDQRSLMYGPIMGTPDLDRIDLGQW